MSQLDDIIKQTVAGLEKQRENINIEGKMLMAPDCGFPVMVQCPTHGNMLTSVNTATWVEQGTRVYYCLKCLADHEREERAKVIKQHCKKCVVLDSGKVTDTVIRPKLKYDGEIDFS